MRISLESLRSVLLENVAEIKFQRRDPKPGASAYRRMLCTNNLPLLNSSQGRTALGFKPPLKSPKYIPKQKNLITTWDIFMQNYRSINMDNCNMISTIPADDTFWEYFTDKLINLTSEQKAAFMNV